MSTESTSSSGGLNPLPDIDFDVRDPNGWFRYVADSLVLAGLAPRSGETYAREVRLLVRRFDRPPFTLTEGDVRTFILERHRTLNGSSQRILYRGLRFLFNDLLKYDWELLKALSAKREIVEPTILSRQEVARLFNSIKTPHIYAYLRTVYSCGFRLSEALNIKPGDIDRARGLLHVRQGKGASRGRGGRDGLTDRRARQQRSEAQRQHSACAPPASLARPLGGWTDACPNNCPLTIS